MAIRRSAVLLIFIAALAIAVACSDSDTAGEAPSKTSTSDETPATRAENEQGEAPIFWRTADNFASMAPDTSYKVLFRITNGYAENRLSMVAIRREDGREIVISSNISEPVGEEAPGSYYPTFLVLPEPGIWDLTVNAGPDQAVIEIVIEEPPL